MANWCHEMSYQLAVWNQGFPIQLQHKQLHRGRVYNKQLSRYHATWADPEKSIPLKKTFSNSGKIGAKTMISQDGDEML